MVLLDQGGRDATELDILAPPADLSRLIEHLWVERRIHTTRSDWRVVPDASPHVIAAVTDCGQARTMRVRLVGPRSCAANVDKSRRMLTVGIRLRPGALPAMVDGSAREFLDRSFGIVDVFGTEVMAGLELAADAPTPLILNELVQLTRRACRRRNRKTILPSTASPRLTVAELARSLGEPTRSLRDRVHREIGLNPKRTLRVLRLHTALHAARQTGRSWSEVAYFAGYADQAHFSREVRALLGETPSAWQARGSAVLFKTASRGIA